MTGAASTSWCTCDRDFLCGDVFAYPGTSAVLVLCLLHVFGYVNCMTMLMGVGTRGCISKHRILSSA